MTTSQESLRVLVVDDEAPARRKLLRLLRDESNVEVVGEGDNAESAIAAIEKHQPDLVFLDVQMPGADGFDVVRAISSNGDGRTGDAPRFVFVTAHDHYAVRAFEVHAFDYLLKPVGEDRFREVLQRAQEQHRKKGRRQRKTLARIDRSGFARPWIFGSPADSRREPRLLRECPRNFLDRIRAKLFDSPLRREIAHDARHARFHRRNARPETIRSHQSQQHRAA